MAYLDYKFTPFYSIKLNKIIYCAFILFYDLCNQREDHEDIELKKSMLKEK